MDVRTFRARSLPEALALVRRELGSQASVLRTREVRAGLMGWIAGARLVEVTASNSIEVPSRLRRAAARRAPAAKTVAPPKSPAALVSAAHAATASLAATSSRAAMSAARERRELAPPVSLRSHFVPTSADSDVGLDLAGDGPATLARRVQSQLADLQSMVTDLYRRSSKDADDLPEAMFRLYAELLDTDMAEPLARQLVDQARNESDLAGCHDMALLKARVAELVAREIPIAGPIRLVDAQRRLVALVGPTGVGKTTTIAKLAAHYRLRQKRRVGLITVDTYRIAAVEQLGAYAGIMDLPMEVVSTPAEMRDAVDRLADMDLVLLDTAGRSARDERQIDELRAMLAEARPDETHLVLSGTANAASQKQTAERFIAAGATAMVLTKLDEAKGLGALLPLARAGGLPISYVTDGQNVPDDIAAADAGRLARRMIGLE